jgi:hypothetical protein
MSAERTFPLAVNRRVYVLTDGPARVFGLSHENTVQRERRL